MQIGLSRTRLLVLFLAALTTQARAADDYPLGPDSQEHEGVPQGKVEQHHWKSRIFNGTERDYWLYVPRQYDPQTPAGVMIFQDGATFVNRQGDFRVPTVFDNLIHQKQMPVTVGVFINPGEVPPHDPKTQAPQYNRSFEYDSPSDQYAKFLLDEILPEVGKNYNLTKDGNSRGLCGISSGGICAFTCAWERPEAFTRVISFVGSFTNLRGGNWYPDIIRKTEPKPIRVYLQDGSNDLDIFAGSWWTANNDMARALKFAGYDYQFVAGEGGHNGKQGGSVLPEALRWVWRDYPKPVALPSEAGKQPVMEILIPGEEWQQVGDTYKFTEGPASDGKGNVYFTDIPNNKIYKLDADGKATLFKDDTGGANGLSFGPDGQLYACQGGRNRVVAYSMNGSEDVIADGIEGVNDIAIDHAGNIYVSEPPKQHVWHITPQHEKKLAYDGKRIAFPNGVRLTPDQSQLIVADTHGVQSYLFQIARTGGLTNMEAFFSAQVHPGFVDTGADGLTVDDQGRVYLTTNLGLQVFDPQGRVVGIINKPQNQWLANVTFGGPNLDSLYVTCGDHVYRRKTKAKGVLSWKEPVLPGKPKL